MKIGYIELLKYLISEEGLNWLQSIRTIARITKLSPSIKEALGDYLQTGKCDLEVAGVSFGELIDREGMKPIRAFLMLDWLERDPVSAIRYLALRGVHADLSRVGSATVSTEQASEQEITNSDIEL